jgi:hypothetical protein
MHAAGFVPDPWQAALLRSNADRILLLCTRQAGTSTTTAALALHTAIDESQVSWLLPMPPPAASLG